MSQDPAQETNPAASGSRLYAMVQALYPICRSITGDGVRQTLDAVGRVIPLEVHEVPSGTQVFDWQVPKEWNIRDAHISAPDGSRLVDFRRCNLHVMSYSVPVRRRMSLAALKPHLYTLPEHPDRIPYRTSYYKEQWGFCLSQRQLDALPDGEYDVCIDSSLAEGHLTYGECFIPGETRTEVLVSTHVCHPSLCNDNLSGIAVASHLAQYLAGLPRRRLSYRFLFIPGTIGSITWLALNEDKVPDIGHGLVVTGVGDAGAFTYKKSRRGDAPIDRAVQHVLGHLGQPFRVQPFSPYGYDERQYCSPGFDLPVGCLMRSAHGTYPEYHTSADDLEFVHPDALEQSLRCCQEVLRVVDGDATYVNLNPKCEPQLGRRGLYAAVGASSHERVDQMALLWVLNLSDGRHSLLRIADRANMPFGEIRRAADALLACGLLAEGGARPGDPHTG